MTKFSRIINDNGKLYLIEKVHYAEIGETYHTRNGKKNNEKYSEWETQIAVVYDVLFEGKKTTLSRIETVTRQFPYEPFTIGDWTTMSAKNEDECIKIMEKKSKKYLEDLLTFYAEVV